MINEIITAFNTIKLENAQKMSQSLDGINDGSVFLDDNYISSEIKRLQALYNTIKDRSLKNGTNIDTAIEINEQIAVLAANNVNYLDISKGILDTVKSDFSVCVDAMILKTHGDDKGALLKFNYFWEKQDYCYDNYLAPVMYAELLIRYTDNLPRAVECLSTALQLRPTDIRVRKMFRDTLLRIGDNTNADIQNMIINTLEHKK